MPFFFKIKKILASIFCRAFCELSLPDAFSKTYNRFGIQEPTRFDLRLHREVNLRQLKNNLA